MKRYILSCAAIMGLTAILTLFTPIVARADESRTSDKTVVLSVQNIIKPFIDMMIITPHFMYSNVDGANIYSKPNVESEILDTTLFNGEFQVIGTYKGWNMISTCDGYAYIKSEYLSEKPIEIINLGEFKITHYCCEKYKHICGTGTGLTRTGMEVKPGIVSVDPKIIPLGSKLIINGEEYIAEDTGGMIKGNKIDIAVETHKEALELGVYRTEVYLIEE